MRSSRLGNDCAGSSGLYCKGKGCFRILYLVHKGGYLSAEEARHQVEVCKVGNPDMLFTSGQAEMKKKVMISLGACS